jgi:hypothetical protein
MQNKKDFGLIFYIHLFLIFVSYTSFLWLDWKIILISVIFLQIYYLFRGGCDLTYIEFGKDEDTTFVWYYLKKIFPNLNQKSTKIIVRYTIPFIIIFLAYLKQKILLNK